MKNTRHLPGCLSSGSIKRMMFGGTNRREHCGLGRDKPSSHEATSEHKKSRTLPVRAREGSAKNLLIGRRETPSKTQRHYGPLLVFIPISKSSLKNLADFHVLFAEITKCTELGSRSPQGRTSVPTGNLHRTYAKVKLKTNNVQLFLIIRCVVIKFFLSSLI